MKEQLGFKVSFKDFFTKDSFMWMQYRFRLKDKSINENDMEVIRMNMEEDAFINMYVKQEINYGLQIVADPIAPDFPTDWVFKEVLKYNIQKISEAYIDKFERLLEEKGYYKSNDQADFAQYTLQKLPDIQQILENLDYSLLDELKESLLHEYGLIVDFLNSFVTKLVTTTDRINFNTNSNVVKLLFFILCRKGIIEKRDIPKQAALFDNHFGYRDEKNNEYKAIKSSKTTLYQLVNGDKDLFLAYAELKKIFLEDNFFEPGPIREW